MKNYILNQLLDFMNYKQCPNCGEEGRCELNEDNLDSYFCHECKYEGSLEEDSDAMNYMWDEGLCGYDEDEKGEVFDWF